MVGVCDGRGSDGGPLAPGFGTCAPRFRSVNSERGVGYRSCSESAARLSPALGTVALSGRTERPPLGLGGGWSGWTVAGWVDEVLRRGAAACADGEDFGVKDVA